MLAEGIGAFNSRVRTGDAVVLVARADAFTKVTRCVVYTVFDL